MDRRQGEDSAGMLFIANPTSFPRSDLAFWSGTLPDGKQLLQGDGSPVRTQAAAEGTWIDVGELPPYSVSSLVVGDSQPPNPVTGVGHAISAGNATLTGGIQPGWRHYPDHDMANQREVLPAGGWPTSSRLSMISPSWDAWMWRFLR
jgi:hypothetical protein